MKKFNIIFFMIILIIIINSGCKKSISSSSDYENKQSGNEKTLKVWIMPNNNHESENDIIELSKPFLKANPNVKLDITVLDWSIAFDKISDALNGTGEKPDITQLGTTWVGMMASLEPGLMDLRGVYNPDDFVEGTLETTKLLKSDKIIAVPWFIDTRVLYYRKDACEKAGIDPSKDFDNWDSFKKALEKLNGIEINGTKMDAMGMPGKNDWNVPHNFSWWIWGAGGDFLDKEAKKSVLDSKESIEGINFYIKIANEGLLSSEGLLKNAVEVEEMFKKGKCSTTITDASLMKEIKEECENYDDFGVTIIPKGPVTRTAFFGGSVLGILESSKNKEIAVDLVKELVSENAQLKYTEQIGHLPALKKVYNNPLIKDDPMKKILVEQIKYGKSYPSIAERGTIEAILSEKMGEIWDIVIEDYDENKIENKIKEISKNVNKVLE